MNLKLSIVALAAVAMVGSAFAQGAGPAGAQGGAQSGGKKGQRQMGGRRGGPMNFDGPVLAKLNLTAAQQTKVKDLKTKLTASMKATMEKNRTSGMDRDAMRESLKTFGKQYKEGMDKILTPAQQKQYKTLMKAEMEKRRKAMGNRPGGRKGGTTPPPASA